MEMERRAARILNRVLGTSGGARAAVAVVQVVGAPPANYAERIGLHASFTIHDRGDAEDLLAIVRHELGLSITKKRFPAKATCLAIYSRAINSQEPLRDVLGGAFPWCAHWEAELKQLFADYVAAKQAQNVLDYDDCCCSGPA
jgi:DNA helicase-2/ATP-dependent DNA helicase PcrA